MIPKEIKSSKQTNLTKSMLSTIRKMSNWPLNVIKPFHLLSLQLQLTSTRNSCDTKVTQFKIFSNADFINLLKNYLYSVSQGTNLYCLCDYSSRWQDPFNILFARSKLAPEIDSLSLLFLLFNLLFCFVYRLF